MHAEWDSYLRIWPGHVGWGETDRLPCCATHSPGSAQASPAALDRAAAPSPRGPLNATAATAASCAAWASRPSWLGWWPTRCWARAVTGLRSASAAVWRRPPPPLASCTAASCSPARPPRAAGARRRGRTTPCQSTSSATRCAAVAADCRCRSKRARSSPTLAPSLHLSQVTKLDTLAGLAVKYNVTVRPRLARSGGAPVPARFPPHPPAAAPALPAAAAFSQHSLPRCCAVSLLRTGV